MGALSIHKKYSIGNLEFQGNNIKGSKLSSEDYSVWRVDRLLCVESGVILYVYV